MLSNELNEISWNCQEEYCPRLYMEIHLHEVDLKTIQGLAVLAFRLEL